MQSDVIMTCIEEKGKEEKRSRGESKKKKEMCECEREYV